MKDQFGHWEVAGKKYYNKLQAVVDAVPNGWWPHFNFNEHKFSLFDWSIEPTETLDLLYNQRAYNIREKYDHITLEFSGGADSWYALYSFVRQGLHVDVVSHKYADAFELGEHNKGAENQSAEAIYQAWPWFNKFKELSPNMEWRLTYVTDMIINRWSRESLDPFKYNIFHIGIIPKLGDSTMSALKFIPFNSKSAIIYGLDKPNLIFEDNKFYLYFPDIPIMHRAVIERSLENLPVDDILFYWDRDCARLLSKQAHLIMNWFKRNPTMLPIISNRHYRDNDIYYGIVDKLIYPEYQRTWQSEKAKGQYKCTNEKWFHNDSKDTTYGDNWHKSMKKLSSVVTDTLTGTQFESLIKTEDNYSILPGMWSKLYYLGSL
jgi:hypothetical protein